MKDKGTLKPLNPIQLSSLERATRASFGISTVISYCTNEHRFLDACIKAVAPFSKEIFIPVCDHFFDGTAENLDILQKNKKDYPEVNFLEFKWEDVGRPARYWHSFARLLGATHAGPQCDWVLFVDADEIVETKRFLKFAPNLCRTGAVDWPTDLAEKFRGGAVESAMPISLLWEDIHSYKLANYWYFREPIYRATEIEDSVVIVRSRVATNINLFADREREQFEYATTPRRVMINGKPLVHHYSWVRTKEQMLKKVKSWGHNADKDWVSLVEEEFSRDFNGHDFLHNYDYITVENNFNL